MIDLNAKNICDFEHHVVFAPNGFGKTRFAGYLQEELTKQKLTVGLFTRRTIDSLVAMDEKSLFFGKTAKDAYDARRIEEAIDDTKTIKNIAKKETNSTAFSKMAEKSCFFAYFKDKISKFDANVLLPGLEEAKKMTGDTFQNLSQDSLLAIDASLDGDLLKEILSILPETTNFIDEAGKRNQISDEDKAFFEKYRGIVKIQNLLECPMCGAKQATSQDLFAKITEKISSYIGTSQLDLASKVRDFSAEVYAIYQKNDFVHHYFADFSIDPQNKIQILVGYKDLCLKEIRTYRDFLLSLPSGDPDSPTLGGVSVLYVGKKNNVAQEADKVKKEAVIAPFICEEFDRLIHRPAGVVISPSENGLQIDVTRDGKPVKSLYEFFSESEYKRLALIVLKAFVKYLDYDCVILDDPIDSYDDYYLSMACDYISDLLLQDCANKKWYLLTNNTNCLIQIVRNTQCNSVVITENPDNLFSSTTTPNSSSGTGSSVSGSSGGGNSGGNNSGNGNFSIPCSPHDIDLINTSEMVLQAGYLNPSCAFSDFHITASDFSSDALPYLAFLVTLRNMRDVVDRKYDFYEATHWTMPYTDYDSEVSDVVERCFMHFDPFSVRPGVPGLNSMNLQLNHVGNVYKDTVVVSNPAVAALQVSSNLVINERTNVLSRPFLSHGGSALLNLIFFFILSISKLKYDFEEKLITTLQSRGVSQADLCIIISAHGLDCKLSKAKATSSIYSIAPSFINSGYAIFSNYRTIINDFDHGLTRMYPPYLSLSLRDLQKFKDDIANWR